MIIAVYNLTQIHLGLLTLEDSQLLLLIVSHSPFMEKYGIIRKTAAMSYSMYLSDPWLGLAGSLSQEQNSNSASLLLPGEIVSPDFHDP